MRNLSIRTCRDAIGRRARAFAGRALCVAAAVACTEPVRNTPAAVPAPTPDLEARLVVSDTLPAAGATLTVVVHVGGKLAAGVASFTTRLAYDTTGLRYVGEAQLADSAMRVTNPMPGLIRSAGVTQSGFADGDLVGYRFTVLRSQAVAQMTLVVDEMHTTARTNALTGLVVRRALTVKK